MKLVIFFYLCSIWKFWYSTPSVTGREINRIIIITDRFETSSGAATVNVTCRYKLHVGFPEWSKWCRIKTRIISSLCIWSLYFTTKTLFSICTQTVIFCKEFSCWCYSNDATLLLGRSHRYKHSTIIITNWLTISQISVNGSFTFYVDFFFTDRHLLDTMCNTVWEFCKKQELFSLWVCVAHLISFLCCVFGFVCLRSVAYAHSCSCLWILHSWLPLPVSLTFI